MPSFLYLARRFFPLKRRRKRRKRRTRRKRRKRSQGGQQSLATALCAFPSIPTHRSTLPPSSRRVCSSAQVFLRATLVDLVTCACAEAAEMDRRLRNWPLGRIYLPTDLKLGRRVDTVTAVALPR
eukprot:1265604-Amphidinium_carterae.2